MPVSRNRKNAPQRQKKALAPLYAGESVLARPGVFRNVSEQVSVSSPLCVIDDVQIPQAFAELFLPRRYKVYYGGRGGAKIWSFADVLITLALKRLLRVLCARELQVSIKDSVHKLLSDRIEARGLSSMFTITDTSIRSVMGSEFVFRGLRHNATEIKSFEGVDICWVEEAQKVSQDSWDVLLPTIRKEGAEVWVSFNPSSPNDPVWQIFVENTPENAIVRKVNWYDNPFFTSTLDEERRRCLATDPDKYAWIWDGEPRVISKAQIFNGRWKSELFDIPTSGVRWFTGADWGFGSDPNTLVRAYIHKFPDGEREIRVCHEVYAEGLEVDDLPTLYTGMPEARRWPINADNSRPELIKYLRRRRFAIRAAKKWPGSIEDGIRWLREIGLNIHPTCVHTLREATLYSYKQDPLTGEILPVIMDKHNHCFDALRYAFDGPIRGKGGLAA